MRSSLRSSRAPSTGSCDRPMTDIPFNIDELREVLPRLLWTGNIGIEDQRSTGFRLRDRLVCAGNPTHLEASPTHLETNPTHLNVNPTHSLWRSTHCGRKPSEPHRRSEGITLNSEDMPWSSEGITFYSKGMTIGCGDSLGKSTHSGWKSTHKKTKSIHKEPKSTHKDDVHSNPLCSGGAWVFFPISPTMSSKPTAPGSLRHE